MSYGHADKIAAILAGIPAVGSEKPIPPIDPALYYRDDVRAVLAVRDIGALFRVLEDVGLTQQEIARLTGQAQSEVAEILAGRKIDDYAVLVRIAEGLGIPRKLMGLSYGDLPSRGHGCRPPGGDEHGDVVQAHAGAG